MNLVLLEAARMISPSSLENIQEAQTLEQKPHRALIVGVAEKVPAGTGAQFKSTLLCTWYVTWANLLSICNYMS